MTPNQQLLQETELSEEGDNTDGTPYTSAATSIDNSDAPSVEMSSNRGGERENDDSSDDETYTNNDSCQDEST